MANSPTVRYEEPVATRTDLAAALLSGDDEAAASALVGVILNDADWSWSQDRCLGLLAHPSLIVRRAAVICLGHVARIHGHIDVGKVVPLLTELGATDVDLTGSVRDALDDIRMFGGA